MLESKNANVVWEHAVINRVGEARNQEPSHVRFNDSPPFGSCGDDCHGFVHRVKELGPQCRNLLFVNLSRLDQLNRGIGMLDYLHPIARRAVFIASSWLIPATVPAESSRSRLTASRTDARSDASGRPASMLSQSAWAKDTFSASGSAIASAVSCFVDMPET